MTTVNNALSGWNQDQLSNLGAILELEIENPSITDLELQIKWLYYSKTRAQVKTTVTKSTAKLRSAIASKESEDIDKDQHYSVPLYSELIYGLAGKLKLKADNASLADYEEYISHAIIIESLNKMSPTQRQTFFNQTIDLGEIVENAGIKDARLKGPLTTMAALGAAQASGLSSYLASTTALGFVTHAVGVTLPVAVSSGITSTIAFAIGPAGWLAVAGWAFWKATGPEWKKLTPAILYIIHTNSYITLALNE
jgi:uncharacterized protein YaaW (UPF0174 family)